MTRKISNGPLRNKERTKKKLIDAVGKIIEKEGFSGIHVLNIAQNAKVDKKLIYVYFGGVDGLVKEYFNSRNFWEFSPQERKNIEKEAKLNGGENTAYQLLENQFDNLMKSGEMRGVVAWELTQNLDLLTQQTQMREKLREEIFDKMISDHSNDKNIRAIEAILMGGISYLTVHTHTNQSTFRGIDLTKEQGQQEIKKAIKQIIDWAHS